MLPAAATRYSSDGNTMLCSTSFVDDVMFSNNGMNGSESKTTRTFRLVRQVELLGTTSASLVSVVSGKGTQCDGTM